MDKFRIGAAVAVLVTVLTFLAVLVHEHADPTMMAALATVAGATITGVLHYIVRTTSQNNGKDPPVGPLSVVLTVGTIFAAAHILGCDLAEQKRVESAGAYANDEGKCALDVPKLGPDAGADDRRREWAKFDDCTAAVHTKWDVKPSPFAATKDGGK